MSAKMVGKEFFCITTTKKVESLSTILVGTWENVHRKMKGGK